ncbi:MAG: calcium/sodium antiporter [Lachnospiraceae bacterium]|nr:calcium/sodium antiporter [Lachnospiraceae bacterium]
MEYIWFLVGLVLIIKGGDFFVDSAVHIAKKFRVSEIIIGATIVSIGTTLPEIMVSTGAALKGLSSISYGNAIGSIICNTAFICAISIICRPMKIDKEPIIIPTIFFFFSTIVYVINVILYRRMSRLLGIFLLILFVVYMVQNVIASKKMRKKLEKEIENINEEKGQKIILDFVILIISGIMIAFGADFMVDNGVIIARSLHVPETVIALTMIALGTSLPELVTAINALMKGHSSLSLGNIIGANLFNIVLVSGLSITVAPFELPDGKLIMGVPSSILVDIPIMFIVMIILTIPSIKAEKICRWQGVALMSIYVLYVMFQYIY